jgi:hypothetical protein
MLLRGHFCLLPEAISPQTGVCFDESMPPMAGQTACAQREPSMQINRAQGADHQKPGLFLFMVKNLSQNYAPRPDGFHCDESE